MLADRHRMWTNINPALVYLLVLEVHEAVGYMYGGERCYTLLTRGRHGMNRHTLNLTTLKYYCINHGDQRIFLNFKSSQMSQLVRSASLDYLCYRSTAIIYFTFFSRWGSTLDVKI